MATGDMARLGELMVEAQAAFDAHAMPMCPNQLTAPNLHRVLNLAGLAPHIWGAKGVGSQGDGCAQLLCRSAADQEAAIQLVTRELGMPCMPLQIGSTRPVTQAVIPAASFPQNLFPASKSLPPALFPVLDADGILKPAILLLVEEAFEAGLQVTGWHSATATTTATTSTSTQSHRLHPPPAAHRGDRLAAAQGGLRGDLPQPAGHPRLQPAAAPPPPVRCAIMAQLWRNYGAILCAIL